MASLRASLRALADRSPLALAHLVRMDREHVPSHEAEYRARRPRCESDSERDCEQQKQGDVGEVSGLVAAGTRNWHSVIAVEASGRRSMEAERQGS